MNPDKPHENTPLVPFNEYSDPIKRKRVHVKGKYQAPQPPIGISKNIHQISEQMGTVPKERKKRPAPRPPGSHGSSGRSDTLVSQLESNSLDANIDRGPKNSAEVNYLGRKDVFGQSTSSKILESGNNNVATTMESDQGAMPRPWYKRNVFVNLGTTKNRASIIMDSGLNKEEEVNSVSSFVTFKDSLSKCNLFHWTHNQPEDNGRHKSRRRSSFSNPINSGDLDMNTTKRQRRVVSVVLDRDIKCLDIKDVRPKSETVQSKSGAPIQSLKTDRSSQREVPDIVSITDASKLREIMMKHKYFDGNSCQDDRTNGTVSINGVCDAEMVGSKRNSLPDELDVVNLTKILKEMKHSLPERTKVSRNTRNGMKKDEASTSVPQLNTEYRSNGVKEAETISSKVIFKFDSRSDAENPETKCAIIYPKMDHSVPVGTSSALKKSPEDNLYTEIIDVVPHAEKEFSEDSNLEVQSRESHSEIKRAQIKDRIHWSGKLSKLRVPDEPETENVKPMSANDLFKRLEAAIISGNHQQAALLARALAELKVPCSILQTTPVYDKPELFHVNMYIENEEGYQGPLPISLLITMTVAQLKQHISTEFGIPVNCQRWIIGKKLIEDDNSTMRELRANDGSPIFLYFLSPHKKNKGNSVVCKKFEYTDKKPDKMPCSSNKIDTDFSEAAADSTVRMSEENKQETKHYEELIYLESHEVISNAELIKCPICFVACGPQEGITLRDCLHSFCRTCIANTILYCEEVEVKCPYRDSVYACEAILQEREIKSLVTADIYDQHLAKSVNQARIRAGNEAFHCKTPDCPGWCFCDENVRNFFCPVCHTNNCLTCQAIHMGKTCREYQEEYRIPEEADETKRTDVMLKEMLDKGEALPCPTCAVVLTKKWGCDWLRCSMCKTEICWITRGPRWGPAGKGDLSGGCKCGENGVKCHPRCNYCH